MQYACRAPQSVAQNEARLGILLQLARQTFCSPLHFIGSARAVCAQSRQSPTTAATADKIL
jgi:hypothetical protein